MRRLVDGIEPMIDADEIAPTFPPAGLPDGLWSRLERAVESEANPLAVFDADGTLWADDLGETHLGVLQERGSIPPGADHASLLDEYRDRCARDVDDGYAWGARVLAALDESVVVESAVEAWRRHSSRLLGPMASIVRGLAGLGVDVAVVSASNRWVVEAAVRELGILPGRVVAVDLHREGGRLTASVVQPMPNGPGKVAAIDVCLGRRPTIAFGNSIHDAPMLALADVGVVVLATTVEEQNLEPAMEALRSESGWDFLPIPHPLQAE